MVHYLFLVWDLPWIILACFGRQHTKKRRRHKMTHKGWRVVKPQHNQKHKKKKQTIRHRRRCMRHLIRTYMVWELIYQIWDRQTVLIKTKKKRKKTGVFKRCILLSLSVKATFDLFDCSWCFAVSVYSHVSHKRINYQTTVTDDSCLPLV